MKPIIPVFVLLGLIVGGCSTTTINTKTTPLEVSITKPTSPRPIKIQPIKITVYSKEDLKKKLDDPEFRQLIGMDLEDYEKLSSNIEEALRYIESQKNIIIYYENVIVDLENRSTLKKANVK